MSHPRELNQAEQWLIKEWTLRLKQSLEAMTGEAAQVQQQAAGEADTAGSSWWRQPFTAAPGAVLVAGAPADTWRAIGARVLSGAGIDDSTEEDQRSTYIEILQQALSGLANGLTGVLGREVLTKDGADGEEPDSFLSLTVRMLDGNAFPMFVGWSAELPSAIEAKQSGGGRKPAAAPEPPPQRPVAQTTPPAAFGGNAETAGAARTLDLLYDVELPVSVSFGRALLPLKEVLKLTSGSIVELNRTVAEPVEIIVNNCVIARGEVVVVDGNYGVRIQQIVSRSERLRTLH